MRAKELDISMGRNVVIISFFPLLTTRFEREPQLRSIYSKWISSETDCGNVPCIAVPSLPSAASIDMCYYYSWPC